MASASAQGFSTSTMEINEGADNGADASGTKGIFALQWLDNNGWYDTI
jgi:hypothetical protein